MSEDKGEVRQPIPKNGLSLKKLDWGDQSDPEKSPGAIAMNAADKIYTASKKIKEELERAKKAAFIDTATDLPNKNAWLETVKHFDPNRGDSGTIIVIDINRLKEINDSLGHTVGDVLIKKMADLIKKTFTRAHDSLFSIGDVNAARIGGDEFLIYARDIQTKEQQQRFEKFVNESFSEEKQKATGISFSFGMAHFDQSIDIEGIDVIGREEDDTHKTTFDRADKAMYKMKNKLKEVS